ncbi:MAG: Protein YciI [Steroidobacteraceae bacterium]|nr:Protein YciI [Steroidobacteraceae bacterium]
MHYLLVYEFVADFMERRAPLRATHLSMAWAAHDRGELVLAGAFTDAPAGSALLFKGDTPEAAERFARADPYVTAGLVTRWQVRPWTTVVGATAAQPMRPGA